MLTKEEQNIVIEAMREYPAGVHASSWGKSLEFFNDEKPELCSCVIESLPDVVLLEGG